MAVYEKTYIDPEYWGGAVSYKYRVEDTRLGRFFSVDPLSPEYPWNSPYAFSENSTIAFVELEGLEKFFAADGTHLGNIGSSCEIRVIKDRSMWDAYNSNQEIGEYGPIVTEQDLMNISSRAYEEHDIDLILKDFGEKYRLESQKKEHGIMVYSNTFYDEDGAGFTVLMPGIVVEGDPADKLGNASVNLTKSTLEIGGGNDKFVAGYVNFGYGHSSFRSEFGWKKYSLVHTHPGSNTSFSLEDFLQSLKENAPTYMIPYSSTTLFKFDPATYNRTTKIKFDKKYDFPGDAMFDKAALKLSVEEEANYFGAKK